VALTRTVGWDVVRANKPLLFADPLLRCLYCSRRSGYRLFDEKLI
jgi:hypothetical protein